MTTTKKTAVNASATKPKRGRPTRYSESLAGAICERIMRGQSLLKVASGIKVDAVTVYRWIEKHPEFRNMYAHARTIQADTLAEQVIAIADEVVVEEKRVGNQIRLDISAAAVQRNRLRVDAIKWYVSKLAPKKYGNRLAATVPGPVQVQTKMTDKIESERASQSESPTGRLASPP